MYYAAANWGAQILHFPVKNLKGINWFKTSFHLSRLSNSHAVTMTMNLLCWVACRTVTWSACTRQCCLGRQTTTRDRHETSHFLHKSPAPSQLWVRHLSAIFLCQLSAKQIHSRLIPGCPLRFEKVKSCRLKQLQEEVGGGGTTFVGIWAGGDW